MWTYVYLISLLNEIKLVLEAHNWFWHVWVFLNRIDLTFRIDSNLMLKFGALPLRIDF